MRAFQWVVRSGCVPIDSLRDVQIQQSLHDPTVQVTLDRERAGLSGVTARDIGESLIAATYSSASGTNDWLQFDGAERVMTGNLDIIAASTNTTAEAAAGNKASR